jgi:hypothetical protein
MGLKVNENYENLEVARSSTVVWDVAAWAGRAILVLTTALIPLVLIALYGLATYAATEILIPEGDEKTSKPLLWVALNTLYLGGMIVASLLCHLAFKVHGMIPPNPEGTPPGIWNDRHTLAGVTVASVALFLSVGIVLVLPFLLSLVSGGMGADGEVGLATMWFIIAFGSMLFFGCLAAIWRMVVHCFVGDRGDTQTIP